MIDRPSAVTESLRSAPAPTSGQRRWPPATSSPTSCTRTTSTEKRWTPLLTGAILERIGEHITDDAIERLEGAEGRLNDGPSFCRSRIWNVHNYSVELGEALSLAEQLDEDGVLRAAHSEKTKSSITPEARAVRPPGSAASCTPRGRPAAPSDSRRCRSDRCTPCPTR